MLRHHHQLYSFFLVLANGFMSSQVDTTSLVSSDASECFPFKGPVGFPGDPGPPGEPGVAVSSPSIKMKIKES